VPDGDHLILGDVCEERARMRQSFAGGVALAHIDLANGDAPSSDRLFAGIAPLLVPLMRPGGIVVSERSLAVEHGTELELPDSVPRGRYWIYRFAGQGPR
jgi:hypothetical protein